MRLLKVPAIVVMATASLSCTRTAAQPAEYHESFSYAAQPGKIVSLELASLDSHIEVLEGDQITVSIDLEARSSSRGAARRWVERRTPTIDDTPSRLEIRVPKRSASMTVFGFFHSRGEVRVTMPRTCRLEIRNSSGDVQLDGDVALDSAVRIETSSGDLAVRGGIRELIAETTSGDVVIVGEPLGIVEIETASGDVRLDSGASRVMVDTTSGDVTLRDLGGELSVDTSSGDVRASWQEIQGAINSRVESSSGDVLLRIPASTAVTGELRTSSGDIRSSFPGEEDRRGRRFRLVPHSAPGEGAVEDTGDRRLDLEVRTASGGITLSRKSD